MLSGSYLGKNGGSIASMKISVSLPAEDVAFLDSYVLRHRVPSRSAVFHEALALLRSSTLEESYAEAFGEWAGSDDEAAWDVVRGDGVTDAPR